MPQKFTPEQLIALLYNELSSAEKTQLLLELKSNVSLQNELNEHAETISLLADAEMEPDPSSVSMILEYSAKANELQHA